MSLTVRGATYISSRSAAKQLAEKPQNFVIPAHAFAEESPFLWLSIKESFLVLLGITK
jgi:hypothetical protein